MDMTRQRRRGDSSFPPPQGDVARQGPRGILGRDRERSPLIPLPR